MNVIRLVGCLCIAMSAVSPPLFAQGMPGAGLAGSAHDFSALGAAIAGTGARVDTCVFCHLEDGIGRADASVVSAVTGWGQKAATQSFFWPAGVSRAGTPLPSNLAVWAGSSRLCLGCHGDAVPPDAPAAGYQVAYATGGTLRVDDGGQRPLWGGTHASQAPVEAGPFGKMTAGLSAKHLRIGMGGNLDGTHVVGVPYPFQGIPGTYNLITTGRNIDLKRYVAIPPRVKLFTLRGTKVVAGTQVGATGMECASCHDVHNKEVAGPRLLRDTAARLCLDCHNM